MKRWIHAASAPKQERALTFQYSSDSAETDASDLEQVLQNNKIEYVVYNDYGVYKFVVRRSGHSWNDLMKLINSVKSARYSYVSTSFGYDENDQLKEVVNGIIHASEDPEKEIYNGFWFTYRNSGIFLKSDATNITDAVARKFINAVCDMKGVGDAIRQSALYSQDTLKDFKRRIDRATLEHKDTGKITYWSIKGNGFAESWPEEDFEDAVTVI